ncbi:LysR family transcriptional regulator [Klebsiella pneumoniae]|uniref:LysR family transcriptional regulator n=1 Tax=Klebsiella pneumoniae TaxID=573 RepID=A0A2X3ITD1_KLEPN|nr:LysR family transcriptional regulator [Klebsiella pneumoniae]
MPIRHVICATEAYLQQHGTPYTPQDLRAHSCISLGRNARRCALEVPSGRQNRNGANLRAVRRQPYRVRLDAVRQHLGIGSLPLFTAREALANGDIVQVLPEWEFISSYSGDLWLLWAGDNICPPGCGR